MYIDVNIVPSTVVAPSAAPRPWVQTPAVPAQTPQNSAELEILQTESQWTRLEQKSLQKLGSTLELYFV